MSKLLHIDFDLQQRNRIFKDGSNLVKQVTDKAQNIPFFAESGEEPSFIYGADGIHYADNSSVVSRGMVSNKVAHEFDDVTFEFSASNKGGTDFQTVIGCDESIRGWTVVFYGTTLRIYNSINYAYSFDLNGVITIDEMNNYLLIYSKTNNKAQLFINGTLRHVTGASLRLLNANSNNYRILGTGFGAAYAFNGELKYVNVYAGNPYNLNYSQADIGSVNEGVKPPFFYYKRYPNTDGNIKAYINSRFLEDAVINSDNEITSVKDEMGAVYTGNLNPKLTKYGIYFNGGNSQYIQRQNTDFLDGVGTGDFTLSTWINIGTLSGYNLYTYLAPHIYIYQNGTSLLGQVGGQNITFKTLTTASNWLHALLLRKSGSVYAFLNGVLININTNIVDLSQEYTTFRLQAAAAIGVDTYFDDSLFAKSALIDPTGKLIGNKVFDENGGFFRRRGLGSEIKQF